MSPASLEHLDVVADGSLRRLPSASASSVVEAARSRSSKTIRPRIVVAERAQLLRVPDDENVLSS